MRSLAGRLQIFAGLLGLLSLQRVFFLLYHWAAFRELSSGALARAAGLGLIIDASTVSVLLLALLPVEMVLAVIDRRKVLRGWLGPPVALAFLDPVHGNRVEVF